MSNTDQSLLETPSLPDSKNTASHEERPHHPYSPSTLQNLEWCPDYQNRQVAKLHVRTVAGTRAHGVADTGEDDSRLSDEDAIAAAECLDFVEQRRQLMQEEADRAAAALNPMILKPKELFQVVELKEVYLPVDDLEFPDCKATTAGYFDRVLLSYDQKYAEGFDWKFGFWPVESPQENLQVIAYTLGLFKRFPRLERVRFWIKQPHLDYVKDAVFSKEQIPELYLRVQTVVARAREARSKGDFSTAKPAVPICNFCGNLGKCPKVAQIACKVGAKFHPADIPADITPSKLQEPDQAALGLRLAAVLKIWADAFKRQVTERILCSEMELPPGHKIQTMSKREIADMEKMKAVSLQFLTEAEFTSTLETTFGALEEMIQEKAPRGQKKNAVKEFQDALESAGAVRKCEPFSFLRAVATKE